MLNIGTDKIRFIFSQIPFLPFKFLGCRFFCSIVCLSFALIILSKTVFFNVNDWNVHKIEIEMTLNLLRWQTHFLNTVLYYISLNKNMASSQADPLMFAYQTCSENIKKISKDDQQNEKLYSWLYVKLAY